MAGFNEAAFKAAWRKRAESLGVDIERGATSYQVAAIKGEMARDVARAQSTDWWKKKAIWLEPGKIRNKLERDVYGAIAGQCPPLAVDVVDSPHPQPLSLMERGADQRHDMTLSEIRAMDVQYERKRNKYLPTGEVKIERTSPPSPLSHRRGGEIQGITSTDKAMLLQASLGRPYIEVM